MVAIEEQEETAASAPSAAAAAAPAPEEPATDPLGEEPAGPAAVAAAAAAPKSLEPAAPPLSPTEPAPPSPKPQAAALPSTPVPTATAGPSPGPKQDGDSPAAPQSMRDRLAFFNAAQNKASPPPVKPKPAGSAGLSWSQRQKLRQEQEAKEREASGGADASPSTAAPAPAQASAPAAAAVPEERSPEPPGDAPRDQGEGMSAADAQASITKGGSLRERMAALQGAGAFGSPGAEKPAPPKPSGKVWSRPTAPEPEVTPEADAEGGEGAEPARVKSPQGEEGDPLAAAGDEGAAEGEGEEDEEAKEKARRAAITARLAKLGARGPLGLPPPMAPKPVRKQTKEVVSETTGDAAPSKVDEKTPEVAAGQADSEPARAASPPSSVPMPPIARRTAGPKRRTVAPAASLAAPEAQRDDLAEGDKRFEREASDGIEPPPQVMVADEEKPLPRTEEQLAQEGKQEAAGRGERGAEGAGAAGIALMPVGTGEEASQSSPTGESEGGGRQPLVGAVGGAGNEDRAAGTVTDTAGPGKIIDKTQGIREMEDEEEEGGAEKDDIMREAEAGGLEPGGGSEPRQIGTVSLAPPAQEEAEHDQEDDEEDDAPPPPPSKRMLGVGKDELEMKHEREAEEQQEEEREEGEEQEDEEDAPPIPQRSGARMPPPPTGSAQVPPRDVDQEEREAAGEGDEEVEEGEEGESQEEREEADEAGEDEDEAGEDETPPPPPPARQATLPAPVQTGLPSIATAAAVPPGTAARSPPASPVRTKSIPPISTDAASEDRTPAEKEEAERRAGIAARMAKLGGVKIGMPPAALGQRPAVPRASGSTGPTSPVNESPRSPIGGPKSPIGGPRSPISEEAPASPAEAGGAPGGGDETPEQEAARRRATLARLRAGGMLGGFNMFNHAAAASSPVEDSRGLESEREAETAEVAESAQEQELEAGEDEEEDVAPPPPPPGRPVRSPSNVHVIPEEDDTPAPPPPARAPSFSSKDIPPSPGKRPPVPQAEKRYSTASIRGAPLATPIPEDLPMVDGQVSREPQVLHEEPEGEAEVPDDDGPPPPMPPGRPGRQPSIETSPRVPMIQTQSPPPKRSMSTASRASRTSTSADSPVLPPNSPARQISRQESVRSQSMSQGDPRSSVSAARPGFNELQMASQQYGAGLYRVAQDLFKQGKKGTYGVSPGSMQGEDRKLTRGQDGSPTGFVSLAMQQAGLPPPQQSLGQLVFEQEGGSVLKRLDEVSYLWAYCDPQAN